MGKYEKLFSDALLEGCLATAKESLPGEQIVDLLLSESRKALNESVCRYCAFFKAVDNNWYMKLAVDEGDSEIETYGPFDSFEEGIQYLDRNFSNPGGFNRDDSGTRPVPKDAIYPKRRW